MILLTSATGSMGRYLIDALTSDGADARAVKVLGRPVLSNADWIAAHADESRN
jgi:uncharacterized protein YbjT (DUF2867 family)